jgi:hypothetical protein
MKHTKIFENSEKNNILIIIDVQKSFNEFLRKITYQN